MQKVPPGCTHWTQLNPHTLPQIGWFLLSLTDPMARPGQSPLLNAALTSGSEIVDRMEAKRAAESAEYAAMLQAHVATDACAHALSTTRLSQLAAKPTFQLLAIIRRVPYHARTELESTSHQPSTLSRAPDVHSQAAVDSGEAPPTCATRKLSDPAGVSQLRY